MVNQVKSLDTNKRWLVKVRGKWHIINCLDDVYKVLDNRDKRLTLRYNTVRRKEKEGMKGIKAIYDNGGKSIDRYTVYFSNPKDWGITRSGIYPYVAMNDAPFHPQGFCQHGEGMLGPHNGKRIWLEQLPEDCQKVVKRDLG